MFLRRNRVLGTLYGWVLYSCYTTACLKIAEERETHCLAARKYILIIIYNLTIRLRARNFYEVIVNEAEARANYRFIEIQSMYNDVRCFFKIISINEELALFFLRKTRPCRVTRGYSISIEKINSE